MYPGYSPENPMQVRDAARSLADLINPLPAIWIEGEITQAKIRPNSDWVFMDLRDVSQESTLNVMLSKNALKIAKITPESGMRVVIHGKPEFWANRGSLIIRAKAIQTLGLGELMIRLEELKQKLANEGLFAASRKRALPFLPQKIGLICGRASAAMHDVIENAQRRWPIIEFATLEVAVQGAKAAGEIIQALKKLNSRDDIEVIVITRGGGSFEDLLPFSDEALIRAVAASKIPTVSAIGHEEDSPLLDLVADVRASTPTDAARKVVPDFDHEFELLDNTLFNLRRIVANAIEREQILLERMLEASGLDSISDFLQPYQDQLDDDLFQLRDQANSKVQKEVLWLGPTKAQLKALSPVATLERGFAIVQLANKKLLKQASDVKSGDNLRIRLAKDSIKAKVE
ncbi:MAG: exodeoxyribonuclease VII large subunit [Candidatus Nanopelagicales bacterium]